MCVRTPKANEDTGTFAAMAGVIAEFEQEAVLN